MIEFKNCTFDAQDTEAATLKKSASNGLILKGSEDVLVENCKFKNRGYFGINVGSEGNVVIKDCVFDCDTIYNPIEGGQSGKGVSNVTVENNTFNGSCGNNFVCFYRYQDGAVINLKGNKYMDANPEQNEIIRISNMTSANATFNVVDDEFAYTSDYVGDYTSYIMCQDYTKVNGVPQDMTKVTVNLSNVKCNNEVITADKIAQGKITFTYENGTGIIDENQPVINFK